MLLRLTSLLGLCTFLGIAWALSQDRRRFPWRTVGWGLGLQFATALFILKTPIGEGLFAGAQRVVDQLNVHAIAGARMVWGPLADAGTLTKGFGPENAFIFAISISATIILVSALSSLLYHWGILQRVVHAMAWVMQRAMGTTGSESLAAASNIFLGQTEAALVVKPYLAKMTRSELMALMITGMSTIASGVLVVYAQMGVSAGHLLTASVLSAPAGLIIAKIMLPETAPSETAAERSATVPPTTVNGIDALCQGTSDGIAMAINVLGMLIAFVAVVAVANGLFGWVQSLVGIAAPVTLENVIGWIHAPLAWLLGVPARDCVAVGQFLGERVVLNEFVGYMHLAEKRAVLDPRSFVLASYALCGFANFASIAIQIGGIGALVPERRTELAQLGLRAMVGGLLGCYVTACVVGVLL